MNIILYIIAALLPFGIALNPLAGIDLPLTRVLITLAALVWIAHILTTKSKVFAQTWLSALVVGFVTVAALSSINVTEPTWFLRKMVFLLNFFVLFFIITTTFAQFDSNTNRRNLRKFLSILAISGVLAMAIGLVFWVLQFVIGAGAVLAWWNQIIAPLLLGQTISSAVTAYSSAYVAVGGQNYLRLVGVFPDPHMAAFFGELLLPLTVGLAISSKHKRWFWLICAIIVLVATLATFTRGAYVGLAAGALVAGAYWLWHIRARAMWLIGSTTISIFALIAIFASPIGERLISINDKTDGSTSARWELWDTAIEQIAQNPALGTGLGQYPLTYMPYADYRLPYYAHNLYLDIAVEIGAIGALIWITLIILAIWRLTRFAQIYHNPLPAYLALGLLIISIHSLFDTPLFSIRVLPLIIIFIAIAALPAYIWQKTIK